MFFSYVFFLQFEIENPKSCALLLTTRCLPNYSVRPRQHVWRNRETDRLGRFEIDDEFKLTCELANLRARTPLVILWV